MPDDHTHLWVALEVTPLIGGVRKIREKCLNGNEERTVEVTLPPIIPHDRRERE